MNVCPIWEASLSHHTLGLVPITAYTCIMYFAGWQKKLNKQTKTIIKKSRKKSESLHRYRRCALWHHSDTKTSRFCPALCARIVFCINLGVIAFELCDLNQIYAKHDACAQRRADFNGGRCRCKQRAHGLLKLTYDQKPEAFSEAYANISLVPLWWFLFYN